MGMTDIEKRALKGGASFMEACGGSDPGCLPHIGPEPQRDLSAACGRRHPRGQERQRTLILMDSLRAHLARLPAATFRPLRTT